ESWSMSGARRARTALARARASVCAALVVLAALAQSRPQTSPSHAGLESILTYIHTGWDSLTRSTTTCSGISDPKLLVAPVLYLPAGFTKPKEVEQMQRECGVKLASLPPITHKGGSPELDWIEPAGLLYLP